MIRTAIRDAVYERRVAVKGENYWLVFGKETTGLDESLLREYESQTVRIPLWGPIRSLNLSNAVSIVVYEAMRQVLAAPKKIM